MFDIRVKHTLTILILSVIIMVFIILFINTNNNAYNEICENVNRKIYVLYTSGEIEDDFRYKYKKHKNEISDYEINTYRPLLDYDNITVSDWNKIALDINKVYEHYDSFVIIHGHSTLTYTASALSFMLEFLDKPVIFTNGNLTTALIVATKSFNNEVVVVTSNGDELRGSRSIPFSDLDFLSPNFRSLHINNTDVSWENKDLEVKLINPKINVVIIKIFPGIDEKYVANVAKNSVNGIILETYGQGKTPLSVNFLKLISSLIKNGIVIVSVSQRNIHIDHEVDIDLINTGVVDGGDMTSECAFAKLYFLLSNVKDRNIIGKLMQMSIRGEISEKITRQTI